MDKGVVSMFYFLLFVDLQQRSMSGYSDYNNIILSTGQNITFTCTEDTLIQWVFNDTFIEKVNNTNRKYSLRDEDRALVIYDVTSADAGFYQCMGKSRTLQTFNVTVLCKYMHHPFILFQYIVSIILAYIYELQNSENYIQCLAYRKFYLIKAQSIYLHIYHMYQAYEIFIRIND